MSRRPLTTTYVVRKVGIPRHTLYSLEVMGYITPRLRTIGNLEMRLYSPEDLEKITLLWKYLKEGFHYDVAYMKAMKDLGGRKR